jgi:hypothetical protein
LLFQDATYKEFAIELHSRWQELGRKIKKEVLDNPEQVSFLAISKQDWLRPVYTIGVKTGTWLVSNA